MVTKKDYLDKLILGKTQTKWFNKGKQQAFRDVLRMMNKNKTPKRNSLRWLIEEKLWSFAYRCKTSHKKDGN